MRPAPPPRPVAPDADPRPPVPVLRLAELPRDAALRLLPPPPLPPTLGRPDLEPPRSAWPDALDGRPADAPPRPAPERGVREGRDGWDGIGSPGSSVRGVAAYRFTCAGNEERPPTGVDGRSSSENSGGDLLSQGVSPQVPSALAVLTAVFGMGTGVAPRLWSPTNSGRHFHAAQRSVGFERLRSNVTCCDLSV